MNNKFLALTYPLLNPNEFEASIVAIHVSEGQQVKKDDVLYTLETTKSAADVESPKAGFIKGIKGKEGDIIIAGEEFAYLSDEEDWVPPVKDIKNQDLNGNDEQIPKGLRISTPALKCAKINNIDLTLLPKGPLLTLEAIKHYLPKEDNIQSKPQSEKPLEVIIFGGGGHGKATIELVQMEGKYNIVGVIDDNLLKGEEILGIPMLGGSDSLPQIFNQGTRKAINAVGGINRIQIRINVFEKLTLAGFSFPNNIHPTAFIEKSATLTSGTQVFPFAYIGSDCTIGKGNIINTRCTISHDCILGNYVNISPGAILAGNVTVGNNALIGMGVTINLGVTIGKNAKIGNGATIKEDVPDGQIVRAGQIWPK